MKFSDITGHSNLIKALKTLTDENRLPHAIMLAGQSGIGKMKLARALAQYIHCSHKSGDSCGKCPSCLQHQNFNHPDLHFIFPVIKKEGSISQELMDKWRLMLQKFPLMEPEQWNNIIDAKNSQPIIYVNESDSLIQKVALSSYREDIKIFIIWLPEKLQTAAANKLLKVIEEPPEDTLFILVSNEPSNVLPTILSRTQRYNLGSISEKEIYEFLVKEKKFDSQTATEVARLSEGSLSHALEIAGESGELKEFTDLFISMMRICYSLQGKKIKETADTMAAFGRAKIIRYLSYCNRMVRENFVYNLMLPQIRQQSQTEEAFSQKFSPFVNEKNVEDLSEQFSKASFDIERNANSKIVCFDLLLQISRLLHLK